MVHVILGLLVISLVVILFKELLELWAIILFILSVTTFMTLAVAIDGGVDMVELFGCVFDFFMRNHGGLILGGIFASFGALSAYLDAWQLGIPFSLTKRSVTYLLEGAIKGSMFFTLTIMIPLLLSLFLLHVMDRNLLIQIFLWPVIVLVGGFVIYFGGIIILSDWINYKIKFYELPKKTKSKYFMYSTLLAIFLIISLVHLDQLLASGDEVFDILDWAAIILLVIYFTLFVIHSLGVIVMSALGKYYDMTKIRDLSLVEIDGQSYFIALPTVHEKFILMKVEKGKFTKERKYFKSPTYTTYTYTPRKFIISDIDGREVNVKRDVLLKAKADKKSSH